MGTITGECDDCLLGNARQKLGKSWANAGRNIYLWQGKAYTYLCTYLIMISSRRERDRPGPIVDDSPSTPIFSILPLSSPNATEFDIFASTCWIGSACNWDLTLRAPCMRYILSYSVYSRMMWVRRSMYVYTYIHISEEERGRHLQRLGY